MKGKRKSPLPNFLLNLLIASLLLFSTGADGAQDNFSPATPDSNAFLQTLTDKERAWLNAHPVIRVYQDPNWPPVEFADARGEPSGMSADYLQLVEQRLGVKFERVRNLTWPEAYSRMKRWEIDMTTCVAVTPERIDFWAFTKPYMTIPIVIATQLDVTYIADMRELSGKKVAVVQGYAIDDWLTRDFPKVQLVKVRKALEGLEMLQRGEVFAYIDNLLILGYYQAKMKISTIKIAGETPYVNAQCMAVRKDWSVLAGILQKALASISEAERNDIYKKWLPTRYEHGFNYTRLWQALAAFAVILLVLAVWIRKLCGEIKRRKQAEEAMRESEERFRILSDAAFEAIVIHEEGVLLNANDQYFKMFGYEPGEALGKQMMAVTIAPEDREFVTKQVAADSLEPYECTGVRKDGTRFAIEIRVRRMEYRGRNVRFGAILDITDRKRAEKLVDEALQLNRTILSESPVGILTYNSSGQCISANKAAAEITGGTVEQLLAQNFRLLESWRNSGMLDAAEKALTTGQVQFLETYDSTTFGRIFWFACRYTPFRYGDELHLLFLLSDITERKLAEEALRRSEEQFRKIFDESPLGIVLSLPSFSFEKANPAFCRMMGYSEDELRSMTFKEITHPDYIKRDVEQVRKVGRRELSCYETEKQYIGKGGRALWGNLLVSAIHDNRGELRYYLSMVMDITERKQAEEDRRILEERLNRAEKMEALGTLAGGVAHDLNNVLGIVVGYAEMLLEKMDVSNPMREDLMLILEGGKRSAAIVQDLLTLARRGVMTRQVINLNAVIMDCQKTPEFEKAVSFNSKVRLIKDMEADILNIIGSSVHLCKTIINLVSNAIEAMPDGGTITIKTRNQYLDRPIQGYDDVREGEYVVLSVADTGEGIPENDIKRIFEPFYTKKVMGRSGTGLGLAVVWGTVKDYNGYINVQSEVGKGTVFTLYFPVIREDVARVPSAVPLSHYIGNDESILVVDDIKEQRELAARMLGNLNYKVATVASGEEAVQYLRDKKADLIVLDMIMDPGMDGLDTYKAIVEIHPRQKAIIVSGFSETDRVSKAQALGAGTYVRKPYVTEKLGMAVRKELDRT